MSDKICAEVSSSGFAIDKTYLARHSRSTMSDSYAYKILRKLEYTTLKGQGVFTGSPVDAQDGFIHLSLAGQLQETLDKHYVDSADLTLVEVDLKACAGEVKFEVSRGGAKFPHLYGALEITAMRRIWPLAADENGRYQLPSEIQSDLEI
ncbi:MAG: DUF952 domain-containing protein [Litorimonas sp.]